MDEILEGGQPPIDSQEGGTQTQEIEKVPTEGTKEAVEVPKQETVGKTFTQKQMNDIMRNRLERDRLSFFNRYGVKDRDGLDGLIGKAQAYEIMKERYEAGKAKNAELEERLAFLSNGINPDREDDIRAYFKGKGLEFNNDALVSELETHPEWRKVVEADSKPKTTIEVLGVEHRGRNVPETDAEKISRIYGI